MHLPSAGAALRLAFAGTPAFARVALEALAAAGYTPELVLTQPDRPAGRGLRLLPSPVKQFALERGWPLAQPRGLRLDGKAAGEAAAARAALAAAAPDVLVVAAYGLLLPAWTLALPRRGCINIHASLLPRWRGAAPIQRAIEAGDASTGVTIMQMDAGLDTGPILLAEALPIAADDTAATLQDRLAVLGGRLVVEVLGQLPSLVPRPQPEAGATYAAKIDKAEAALDWRLAAVQIERRVRAFDPFPGCHFEFGGAAVKLWRARVVEGQGEPGRVLHAADGRLVVACGTGALELLTLQRSGGRRITAREFLHAHPVSGPTVFGPARA